MKKNEGYASLQALLVVLFISLLSVGTANLVMNLRAALPDEDMAFPSEQSMQYLEEIISSLEDDYSLGYDSQYNAVFESVQANDDVTITDVSSRLNPNWLDEDILSSEAFLELFLDGAGTGMVQNLRLSQALSYDIQITFKDVFTEKAFNEYLSPYSFISLDTVDEYVIENLITDTTGDTQQANALRERISTARLDNRAVDPAAVKQVQLDDTLLRFIGLQAQYNVNLIDAALFRMLIKTCRQEIKNPEAIVSALLQERERQPITSAKMKQVLPLPKEHLFYSLFGDKTWFWEILIDDIHGTLRVYIARRQPLINELLTEQGAAVENTGNNYSIIRWEYLQDGTD